MIPNEPGIYPGLPMADYLAIAALSATPARAMIEQCGRSAWWCSHHNPDKPRDHSTIQDVGSAAHSVLLEDSWACVVEIDPAEHLSKTGVIPKGFTNDAIKQARDDVYAAGRYPILKGGIGPIRDMVSTARAFIGSLQHVEPHVWRSFQPDGGRSETTIVWAEGDGMLCKLRIDRVASDWSIITDYKTSGTSVEPARFTRSMLHGDMGYSFNAAWYRRGVHAITDVLPDYLWLAQETDAPYLCSLTGENPDAVALADEKVDAAVAKWEIALRTGQFDGYPNRVCYPEMPAYERVKWDARVIVGADGIDYGSQA